MGRSPRSASIATASFTTPPSKGASSASRERNDRLPANKKTSAGRPEIMGQGVAILGIFVADLAFRAGRMPAIGETIAGSGFKMGPGGKGSNQAVAAARAGAKVSFISKLGTDAFGDIALATWKAEGIAACVAQTVDHPTG